MKFLTAACLLIIVGASLQGASAAPPPGYVATDELGETANYYNDPLWWDKSIEKFGSTWSAFINGRKSVITTDCDATETILKNTFVNVGQQWPDSVWKIAGGPLNFLNAPQLHAQTRALFGFILSPPNIAEFIKQANAVVDKYVAKWIADDDVNLYLETGNVISDIMATIMLGKTLPDDVLKKSHTLYETANAGSFSVPLLTTYSTDTTWGASLVANEKYNSLWKELIGERLTEFGQGAPMNNSILGLAVMATVGGGVPFEKITASGMLAIARGLFFGAYATTTALTARMLYEVPGLSAAYKAALAKEQAALFGTNGNYISLNTLNKMPYLDALQKEVLRFQPFDIYRKVTTDIKVDGYDVKKGTIIILPLMDKCARKQKYPNTTPSNVDSFKPARWLAKSGNCSTVLGNPEMYVPFGGSVHQCPGRYLAQSISKLIVSHAMRESVWTRNNVGKYVIPQTLSYTTPGYTARQATINLQARAMSAATGPKCPGMGIWPDQLA